ncbi:MAG: acyl-CoA dehydrogenase family protein [Solirubrobacterales bacterium]
MRQNCQNVSASAPRRRQGHSPRCSSGNSQRHPRPEPDLDFQLTDEQRLISESAREFCDKEIAPRVRDNDRAGRFDRELASKLGEMGYLGAPVSEEYGGRSLDYLSYALIVEQVGRVDSSARTVVSVQTSLVAGSIERWGTEEQKQRWLPRLCSGEALGCFALTEPDAGSDPASMRTRAKKTDSGWTITGNKMWISMGNVSELALVFAQTDPEKKHKGLAAFLVPTATDGYGSQEIHGKLGLRSSDTAEISLDEVEVPDDALLGEVGDGFKIAMSSLDNGRYSVAAGCVGICDGCVDASVTYAKERRQFGVPIASFQLVQELIADMIVKRDAARLLVYRAGELKDRGVRNTIETSIAKYYATEAAVECANAAIQVHGGSGYVDDYPVERYLRDARVTTLYEGTSQIHKLIIGRDATGINAMVPPTADS